ncbi:MAG: hypothetical protein ACPGXY_04430, partial [Alphaproteobacteria bacterium]
MSLLFVMPGAFASNVGVPADVLRLIARNLSPQDYTSFLSTCKDVRRIDKESYWIEKCNKHGINKPLYHYSWKDTFILCHMAAPTEKQLKTDRAWSLRRILFAALMGHPRAMGYIGQHIRVDDREAIKDLPFNFLEAFESGKYSVLFQILREKYHTVKTLTENPDYNDWLLNPETEAMTDPLLKFAQDHPDPLVGLIPALRKGKETILSLEKPQTPFQLYYFGMVASAEADFDTSNKARIQYLLKYLEHSQNPYVHEKLFWLYIYEEQQDRAKVHLMIAAIQGSSSACSIAGNIYLTGELKLDQTAGDITVRKRALFVHDLGRYHFFVLMGCLWDQSIDRLSEHYGAKVHFKYLGSNCVIFPCQVRQQEAVDSMVEVDPDLKRWAMTIDQQMKTARVLADQARYKEAILYLNAAKRKLEKGGMEYSGGNDLFCCLQMIGECHEQLGNYRRACWRLAQAGVLYLNEDLRIRYGLHLWY